MKKTSRFKIFGMALVLALLATSVLTGCGSSNTSSSATSSSTFYGIISTGSTEATVYAMGASMSKLVAATYPEVQLSVQASGGGQENQENLAAKRVEFGFVYSPDISYAMANDTRFNDLRSVYAFPYGALQIITLGDSGIQTIADLKGKKVSVGAPGSSGATVIWPKILSYYGIDDKNTKFEYLNTSTAADALKDGVIDAMTLLTKDAVAGVSNVALTKKVRLVSIPHDATVDKIIKEVPGYYKAQGKKDLYGKNQVNDAPSPTLGLSSIFTTRSNVPDDVVYKTLKATFENLPEFSKSHASAKDVQIDTALDALIMPLHPGAEKYYKEVGKLK